MRTLAVVAGLLGLGWLVTRKPKPKKKTATLPPPGPTPPPEPGPTPPPSPPSGGYVGTGWSWPHKDKFPNEEAFGQSLQLLGYNAGNWASDPDYSMLDPQPKAAVMEFQEDFNFLMAFRNYMEGEPGYEPEPGMPPVRPKLAEDGKLGPKSIQALLDAFQYEKVAGQNWYDIIDGAEEELGVA